MERRETSTHAMHMLLQLLAARSSLADPSRRQLTKMWSEVETFPVRSEALFEQFVTNHGRLSTRLVAAAAAAMEETMCQQN